MGNEVMEATAVTQEVTLAHDPNKVLADAKRAATALMTVVSQKKKPVIMNGEQYLEFEDWQTVAKFYGVTAKVVKTDIITIGNVTGFEATAEAIRLTDGMAISSATAMCLNDEDKWSMRAKYELVNGKREKVGEVAVPLFQLRSMAQTRACAKALRNVLAWVVVLAGFKPTPAEEMTGTEQAPAAAQPTPGAVVDAEGWPAEYAAKKPTVKPPMAKSNGTKPAGDTISEPQGKRLFAIAMGTMGTVDVFKAWLKDNYGYSGSRDILKSQYEEICNAAAAYEA